MTAVLAIAFAAVTYAVNTWKIRLVAEGKALAAASMEAIQGFPYLYVSATFVFSRNRKRARGFRCAAFSRVGLLDPS